MIFTLPWPPSVNHYWVRNRNGSVRLSQEAKDFRAAVMIVARIDRQPVKPITGRLIVGLCCHPPDNRRRDVDNLAKAVLDALQHAGIYRDDSQIKVLVSFMGDVIKGNPYCHVAIELAKEHEDCMFHGSGMFGKSQAQLGTK